MKDPEFDLDIIQPKHVALLREVAEGQTEWRNGIPHLLRRGLVEHDGLHAVKVSGKGAFALRGIFPGVIVQVSNLYKLPHMHGAVGVVESVDTRMEDSDGVDEYGYTIKRARPKTSATVRFGDRFGQWIIYSPEALVGFPKLKAEINEYWRNVC